MNDQIARAIANLIIFLEYSQQDILDEDHSVKALEQLGGDLKMLDAESLSSLCASFRSIASEYDGEFRTFVAEIPEAFGLEELPEDGEGS